MFDHRHGAAGAPRHDVQGTNDLVATAVNQWRLSSTFLVTGLWLLSLEIGVVA